MSLGLGAWKSCDGTHVHTQQGGDMVSLPQSTTNPEPVPEELEGQW